MHVRFSYQALTAGRYEVGIAGDFTHWKILSLQDFGGLYLIDFDLKPGRYRYKYIIDGVWKTDPANSLQEADPYGGSNSIIVVEDEKPPKSWDEALNAAAKQDARSFINAFRPSAVALELRFSWYAGLADEIWFEFSDAKLPMFPLGRKSGLMIWHRQIKIRQPRRFHVCIRHREKTVYMGMEGFVQRKKDATPLVVDPSSWRVFEIPQWLKSSVVYQIFPDRFCNGNPDNDQDFSESYYQASNIKPKPGEILGPNREYFHLVKDWSDISTLKQSPWQEEGIPDWHSFYGGDIEGVVQKLDYLVDTGINLIYFNPLW
ncbi:MAG: cyclomaltodextrinase, partial [Candidatus Cloacimonadaceae bacterium]